MPLDSIRKKNLIFLAFVLIVATGYYFFISQGSPSFRFSAEKRVFSFHGPKQTAAVFSVDDLLALELYDGAAAAYGTPVNGGKVWGGYLYGTWKNDTLGEYEAFASERFNTYIIARDAEKTAIFNTSNAETTRSLYQQLYDFTIKQGGLPDDHQD